MEQDLPNGSMWAKNLDGTISIGVGDCSLTKNQWSKVIREYAIQEGFCLQRIKK